MTVLLLIGTLGDLGLTMTTFFLHLDGSECVYFGVASAGQSATVSCSETLELLVVRCSGPVLMVLLLADDL